MDLSGDSEGTASLCPSPAAFPKEGRPSRRRQALSRARGTDRVPDVTGPA